MSSLGAEKTVKVAVLVSEPFVIKSETGFSGFAIDLWERSALNLGFQYEYQEVQDIPSLLNSLVDGRADVAITELTVTSERMARMDFTQPWFDSGLRIMVHRENLQGFGGFMRTLEESGHIPTLIWLSVLVVVMTLVLTLVDRKFDPEFTPRWSRGLAESFYHVMTLLTSGSTKHKPLFGSIGQVIAALWLVIGVGIVTYIGSAVTAVMTTNSLEARLFRIESSKIKGVDDLKAKTVGILKGSAAGKLLHERQIKTREFEGIPELMTALSLDTIDASLADEPSIKYYLLHHPDLNVAPVGPLVRNEKYAFAVRRDSPLRIPLSKEVVSASEGGLLKQWHDHYFEGH